MFSYATFRIKAQYHYGQTSGVYISRTFGGDCHHCVVDGDIDADIESGTETGKGGHLSVEPEPVGQNLYDVYDGKQRLFRQRQQRKGVDTDAGAVLQ